VWVGPLNNNDPAQGLPILKYGTGLFVCPRAYLRNYTRDRYQFLCMLPMHGRGSALLGWHCDILCTSCLRMTSCLHIMAGIGDAKRHILKVTHQRAASDWGRSLISTIALCCALHFPCFVTEIQNLDDKSE